MIYPQRTHTRDLFELNGIWDFARELENGGHANGFSPEKQVAVPSSYNVSGGSGGGRCCAKPDGQTDSALKPGEASSWLAEARELGGWSSWATDGGRP